MIMHIQCMRIWERAMSYDECVQSIKEGKEINKKVWDVTKYSYRFERVLGFLINTNNLDQENQYRLMGFIDSLARSPRTKAENSSVRSLAGGHNN